MSATLAESAARLAGLAGALLGWRPDEFWRATPAELAVVLKALAGLALMTLAPASWSFALFHALLFPVATTIFGQVFTLIRLASARYDEHDRRVIVATVRAAVSMVSMICSAISSSHAISMRTLGRKSTWYSLPR